jgi:antitoxin VapB
MTAQLNIKNGEAYRLATELSAITGESLTEAVTRALAERMAREKERREPRRLSTEEIERRRSSAREIQAAAKALRRPGVQFTDDDLYDENGLPK